MNKKIVFAGLVAIFLASLLLANVALAQSTTYVPQGPCKSDDKLGVCISTIYKWALGVSVLLALAMIILSGYLYMSAGGNAQQVSTAKEIFAGAFIGLIILFSAIVILRTINPDLVNLKDTVVINSSSTLPPAPPPPPPI